MKILITYGGTKEAIDKIRYIGNTSSGQTGYTIAKHFQEQGYNIDVLRAQGTRPHHAEEDQVFTSHNDLDNILKQKLKMQSYDFVIHAAAVSDYSVESITNENQKPLDSVGGKIASGQDIQIHLQATKKILAEIKNYSFNKDLKLIAFKLTDGANAKECIEAVQKVCDNGADYVVYNDLGEINESSHNGKVFCNNLEAIKSFSTKRELADSLLDIVKENQ